MKAIDLRARAACDEALCGGNDGEWIRRGSKGIEGLATPISLLDGIWRDSCCPTFPLHSSRQPPNNKGNFETRGLCTVLLPIG